MARSLGAAVVGVDRDVDAACRWWRGAGGEQTMARQVKRHRLAKARPAHRHRRVIGRHVHATWTAARERDRRTPRYHRTVTAAWRVPGRPREMSYARRRPENNTLHRVVRENVETLYAAIEAGDAGALPAFVRKEIESYLDCALITLPGDPPRSYRQDA
jgi:hypothetical protein